MAQKILISLLHVTIICAMFTRINTFSMPMIPIDSPKLQMFPQNFTTTQRYQLLKNLTMSRASLYSTRLNSNTSINSIEGHVYAQLSSYYVTQIFFGTSRDLLNAYLLLDSGGRSTWVQCDGCDKCIQLKTENVKVQNSISYKLLSFQDERCDPRYTLDGQWCYFRNVYGGGSTSIGRMGTDTFVFLDSTTRSPMFFPDIAFGCGYTNTDFKFGLNNGPNNMIAGIFGLRPSGPASIMTQLDAYIKGRFSYCLTSMIEVYPGISTIQFGDGAQVEGVGVQEIRMVVHGLYHLFFNGISVDTIRLPIDPSACALDTTKFNKGFYIDSGAPVTSLPPSVYQPLRAHLVSHFARYGFSLIHHPGFDLCYATGYSTGQFPNVVFHFQQPSGGLESFWIMTKDNMFIRLDDNDGFCLMMQETREEGFCLFGAFQQTNFKILYDYKNLKLVFKPQLCQENRDL